MVRPDRFILVDDDRFLLSAVIPYTEHPTAIWAFILYEDVLSVALTRNADRYGHICLTNTVRSLQKLLRQRIPLFEVQDLCL